MSDFEDRFAIGELIDRWSDGTNERDWPALEEVFTEDGVWDVGAPFAFRIEGNKKIVAHLRELMGPSEYVVQTAHAKVVWLDGNQAKARSTIHEVCRFKDGTGLEMAGTYYDDLIRDDKGWRFKKRTYRCIYFNPQPPAGQVIKTFPEQA
jgi:ketosteroid isomerase-like protein